jgi:hypothetical protein
VVYGRFADNVSRNSDGQRTDGTNQDPSPNINDFLIPDVVQFHNTSPTNFPQSAPQPPSIHSPTTFLLNKNSKLLHPFQLHTQPYPSLLQGLKTCYFFTEILSNDITSTFSLLIRDESWEVVGWTEEFGEWRELLLGEEGI